MKKTLKTIANLLLFLSIQIFLSAAFISADAGELPGKGISVQPVDQGLIEEVFQLEILTAGLKRLGYNIKPSISLTQEVGTPHLMVAQGDAQFYAAHWDPLHDYFYEKVGGQETVYRIGTFIEGCAQGYLIDRKTADQFHIRSIDRMKDPGIAALFDTDADDRADLAGCHEGWGCFLVIENHLDYYQLRDVIDHKQENYFEMIDAVIERFKAGKPVFYYTWTPLWVNGVLVPGKDVQWLSVPAAGSGGSGLTGSPLPGGGDSGFEINTMRILANKAFIDGNPAAKRFFELAAIPINDISAQNLKIRNGERYTRDIRRHADEWIKAHQQQFDAWISEALKSAP